MSSSNFIQPARLPSGQSELEYDLHHVVQNNTQQAQQQFYSDTSAMAAGLPSFQEPDPIDMGANYQDGYSVYPDPEHHFPYPHGENYTYTELGLRTPPTMTRSPASHSTAGRSTRSGRVLTRTDSPMSSDTRVSKTRPKPKTRRPTKELPPEYRLEVPFTLLNVDWGDIPLKAVDRRANWSKEERKTQATKKDGRIARPMNCFMLYRSAWADRCKHYFKTTNHQLVSAIGAHSWKMEDKAVQDHWRALSKEESDNHRTHLPDYRYQPTKPPVRKDEDEPDVHEAGTDKDPDGDYMPSPRSSKQLRRQQPMPVQHISAGQYGHELYDNHGQMGVVGWGYDYEQQPHVIQYGQAQPYPDHDGHYLQAAGHHQWQIPIDEARLLNHTPASMYSSGHGLVGLPGGLPQDAIQLSRTQTPLEQYHQPQMGNNFIEQTGGLYPIQHDIGTTFESQPGPELHFASAMGDFDAPIESGAVLQDGSWLDPALNGNIQSEYSFALED